MNEHLKHKHPEKVHRIIQKMRGEQDIRVNERILKDRDQHETLKGKNLRTEFREGVLAGRWSFNGRNGLIQPS